ncbi:hypothetical protein XFEB_01741 [Xylella fastidiosa EB92.1]|nr:hypothetical protein XFEB_01741 [Xylella fastidiosa EB92.1]
MFLIIEWIVMMGFIWCKAIAIIISVPITDFIPHMPHSRLARFVIPRILEPCSSASNINRYRIHIISFVLFSSVGSAKSNLGI